jgi:hypothetical protein
MTHLFLEAAAGWLQPIGIIAGLVFSGIALRNDVRSRRLESRIKITEGHREIWFAIIEDPSLERIRHREADLELFPVTPAENRLVRAVFQHILLTYEARSSGQLGDIGDFDDDVRAFLSNPIPRQVWREIARFQPAAFRRFLESLLS